MNGQGDGYISPPRQQDRRPAAAVNADLRRLTADVAPENDRAQRFFRKLGYTVGPSGTLERDLG